MDVAVIGGGAAGFFAAIAVRENYPQIRVVLFEKSRTPLAKVKASGGGRCNLTNACSSRSELVAAYPRGGSFLKKCFGVFDNRDAMNWFEQRGVPLVVQKDGCVFPRSQNSQSVIDCLLEQTRKLGVCVATETGVAAIVPMGHRLQVHFSAGSVSPRIFDKVIVASGGSPKRSGLEWLARCGHRIVEPVPSLFSFNVPANPLTELTGIVVDKTLVGLQGTRFQAAGPLLITHWGLSGPAILQLSSRGARWLSDRHYAFGLQVNWTGERSQQWTADALRRIADEHPNKNLSSVRPCALPERLWQHLLDKTSMPKGKCWKDLGRSGLNKLTNALTNDCYAVEGRTRFKEEFVTCGGISLDDVDVKTLQSRACTNLYFAGEVLDIDGLTGGFNLQAAWTTAFIAAKLA